MYLILMRRAGMHFQSKRRGEDAQRPMCRGVDIRSEVDIRCEWA
jgi:hypothetical protein